MLYVNSFKCRKRHINTGARLVQSKGLCTLSEIVVRNSRTLKNKYDLTLCQSPTVRLVAQDIREGKKYPIP